MQNSVNFPWVNPSNFTSNSSNSNKNVWQDYQNLAADFLLKNQNLKNQNIYSPSISQLAHSNYLEKMSNLAANSNDMQLNNLNSNQSQSQLPDLNDLNSLSGLNEKWNQLPNSGHLMLSNSSANLQSNHHSSKHHHSNGLAETSNLHSNSFSNHNGNSTQHHSTSGSGRKCLNKGNFLCVVCNKSFTQKGNLKTHQLIHTGTKPFICTVCGKGFTQKGNVDTHMRIHNGQKKIKKIKQKDFMNKDLNRRDDFKFNQIQRHKDNNQDLNMNQNQSVIDRLLPMQSLNNTNSPINFSNSHHNSTASTSNWSNLANNLINNSAINKTNRNSTSSSSTSNFQSSYDDFANNLSNYNTFTQMNSTHNLHHKLLEQLNQNGKNSPIQNSMQQQQIDYNAIDFPLLQ